MPWTCLLIVATALAIYATGMDVPTGRRRISKSGVITNQPTESCRPTPPEVVDACHDIDESDLEEYVFTRIPSCHGSENFELTQESSLDVLAGKRRSMGSSTSSIRSAPVFPDFEEVDDDMSSSQSTSSDYIPGLLHARLVHDQDDDTSSERPSSTRSWGFPSVGSMFGGSQSLDDSSNSLSRSHPGSSFTNRKEADIPTESSDIAQEFDEGILEEARLRNIDPRIVAMTGMQWRTQMAEMKERTEATARSAERKAARWERVRPCVEAVQRYMPGALYERLPTPLQNSLRGMYRAPYVCCNGQLTESGKCRVYHAAGAGVAVVGCSLCCGQICCSGIPWCGIPPMMQYIPGFVQGCKELFTKGKFY